MNKSEIRTTAIVVAPEGEPLFSEMATRISIEDEAAGEFVEINQDAPECGKIKIDPDEWPTIRKAIDQMISECRVIGSKNLE